MKKIEKRILGLISFMLAFLLFSSLYNIKKEDIIFKSKLSQIKKDSDFHMSYSRKCKCFELTLGIEDDIRNSRSIVRGLNNLNKTCTILIHLENFYSLNALRAMIPEGNWIRTDLNYLEKLALKYLYVSDQILRNYIEELKIAIRARDLDNILRLYKKIPPSFLTEEGRFWFSDLTLLVQNVMILREINKYMFSV